MCQKTCFVFLPTYFCVAERRKIFYDVEREKNLWVMKESGMIKILTCAFIGAVILIGGVVLSSISASAQNYSVSTNLAGWMEMGSVNAEAGMPVAKNWSIYLQGEYNPFHYDMWGRRRQYKHLEFSTGAKFWPWYVNSGWFLSGYVNWIKYSFGGVIDRKSYEGNAVGLTVGGGYALMLSKGLNLEMGLGAFAGATNYTRYSCIKCGKIEAKKKKIIVAPNNVIIQLTMLF